MRKTILCYGDSNTFGYVPAGGGKWYPEDVRWTGVLQDDLGDAYRVIEEGCSGRTTDIDPPVFQIVLCAGVPFTDCVRPIGFTSKKAKAYPDDCLLQRCIDCGTVLCFSI